MKRKLNKNLLLDTIRTTNEMVRMDLIQHSRGVVAMLRFSRLSLIIKLTEHEVANMVTL